MAKYPFLSDEWLEAVEKLVAENPPATQGEALFVNYSVTESPFGADPEFHTLSSGGKGGFRRGHHDGADVTITTDYATARDVFTSGNPQGGLQAFMAGKVKIQGDLTKLLEAQAAGGADPASEELGRQIIELTG